MRRPSTSASKFGSHTSSMHCARSDAVALLIELGAAGEDGPDSDRLVPHWVELDEFHTDWNGDHKRPPLLIMQPARPLKHNTVYVVGVRGLKATHGVTLPAQYVFETVRSCVGNTGQERAQCAVATLGGKLWPLQRATEFETVVFPALERQGFGHRTTQRSAPPFDKYSRYRYIYP